MSTNLPSDPKSPWSGTKPSTEVAEFLRELQTRNPAGPTFRRGRLIFALDATASRGPTWDHACRIQGEMFEATAALGGIDIQLVFYRGFNECCKSPWVSSAAQLHHFMRKVSTVGGYTQLARVLDHAVGATKTKKVDALVFVGDAFEEKIDDVCAPAGELGSLGVPAFMFHEGDDPRAESAFKQIAVLTRGQYLAFSLATISRLKDLLGGIAVYASGNQQALLEYGRQKGGETLRLVTQLKLLTGPAKPGGAS